MLIASNSLPPVTLNPVTALKSDNFRQNGVIKAQSKSNKRAIAIPNYTSGVVSVSVPVRPHGFTEVVVNGEILKQTNNNPPSVGEYYYDYNSQLIYLYPSSNASGLSVSLSYPNSVIPPQEPPPEEPPPEEPPQSIDDLPPTRIVFTTVPEEEYTEYADIFTKFNVVGTFQFSRQFQGSPSASLTIIDGIEEEEDWEKIVEFFAPMTPFKIHELGLRVSEITHPTYNTKTKKIEFSINFQGKWDAQGQTSDNPLDKPVSLRQIVSEDSDGYYYTLGAVAARVGVVLSGGSRKIRTGKPIQSGSSVTLRSLLSNERFYPDGKIIDWESFDGIKLREWDAMPTTIIEGRLINLPGKIGSKAKLSNASFSLDFVGSSTQNDGDVYSVLETGREDYYAPPKTLKGGWYYEQFNIEQLKTPAWCFDVSADKTEHGLFYQLNGTTLNSVEETWGWVYSSADVYDFRIDGDNTVHYIFDVQSALLNASWQVVKTVTKTHEYDSSDGNYLKLVKGTVKELKRLTPEQDNEAIQLVVAAVLETDLEAKAQLQKQLAGYSNFFWVEYPYLEEYNLEDLSIKYPDVKSNSDENSIPYYYAKKFLKSSGKALSFPHPQSSAEESQPDIVLGELQKEVQEIFITSVVPEKYRATSHTFTQKGENLNQTASATSSEEQNGRPSQSPRLEYFGYVKPNRGNDEDEQGKTYLISTSGDSFGNNIENGSISFPDIEKVSQAVKGVATQYSILNSQNERTITILTLEPYDLIMGQLVSFEGELWRVFNYTEQWEIKGKNINRKSIEIELGKDVSESASAIKLS